MVLPIADEPIKHVTSPVVTWLLIVANVAVFGLLQGFGFDDDFTFAFATVPREIVTGRDLVTPNRQVEDPWTGQMLTAPGLKPTPISVYLTLVTGIFMHGSVFHLLGNMLFLWIFGDDVEEAIGHGRYLIFYLMCGIIASLAHVFTVVGVEGVDSEAAAVPTLGASGAISGVLAGYVLQFPQRRVLVLVIRILVWVPAYVAIGIWFAFQLINGLGVLGEGSQHSSVAYAAHIGGFLAGAALIKPFALGIEAPPEPAVTEST
ncbi:MAG: rhomboid family intramembrane serine protease [Planctomycetes bacterium]|nr:rhomboid family intramembrane serine protease [Planctomycetota bacterium]